jgi:hypothetical protein
MRRYFVRSWSRPAPFCGDLAEDYVMAANAEKALDKFVYEYRHPAGLRRALIYANHWTFHRDPIDYIIAWEASEAEEAA